MNDFFIQFGICKMQSTECQWNNTSMEDITTPECAFAVPASTVHLKVKQFYIFFRLSSALCWIVKHLILNFLSNSFCLWIKLCQMNIWVFGNIMQPTNIHMSNKYYTNLTLQLQSYSHILILSIKLHLKNRHIKTICVWVLKWMKSYLLQF